MRDENTSPPMVRRICVYCGSGNGVNPSFARAANILGRTMAEAGIGLVYGSGSLGLMGEVARAVLGAGGRGHRHHPGISLRAGTYASRRAGIDRHRHHART